MLRHFSNLLKNIIRLCSAVYIEAVKAVVRSSVATINVVLCCYILESFCCRESPNQEIGFEWVIPYVIPCEGYLVAMQFLDLTGGNFFVSSLTLLDGSFQV